MQCYPLHLGSTLVTPGPLLTEVFHKTALRSRRRLSRASSLVTTSSRQWVSALPHPNVRLRPFANVGQTRQSAKKACCAKMATKRLRADTHARANSNRHTRNVKHRGPHAHASKRGHPHTDAFSTHTIHIPHTPKHPNTHQHKYDTCTRAHAHTHTHTTFPIFQYFP